MFWITSFLWILTFFIWFIIVNFLLKNNNIITNTKLSFLFYFVWLLIIGYFTMLFLKIPELNILFSESFNIWIKDLSNILKYYIWVSFYEELLKIIWWILIWIILYFISSLKFIKSLVIWLIIWIISFITIENILYLDSLYINNYEKHTLVSKIFKNEINKKEIIVKKDNINNNIWELNNSSLNIDNKNNKEETKEEIELSYNQKYITTFFLRTIFSSMMHFSFTWIFVFFLLFAINNYKTIIQRILVIWVWLIIAIILHTINNVFLTIWLWWFITFWTIIIFIFIYNSFLFSFFDWLYEIY